MSTSNKVRRKFKDYEGTGTELIKDYLKAVNPEGVGLKANIEFFNQWDRSTVRVEVKVHGPNLLVNGKDVAKRVKTSGGYVIVRASSGGKVGKVVSLIKINQLVDKADNLLSTYNEHLDVEEALSDLTDNHLVELSTALDEVIDGDAWVHYINDNHVKDLNKVARVLGLGPELRISKTEVKRLKALHNQQRLGPKGYEDHELYNQCLQHLKIMLGNYQTTVKLD
jgi:hypothetical protein